MKHLRAASLLVFTISIALTTAASSADAKKPEPEKKPLPDHLKELAWAYAITIEKPPPLPEDDKKHSLPDTPLKFTRDEIVGRKGGVAFQTAPADWYPGDHPKMPEIYAKGDPSRKVVACALCHYPNGKGKAENAPPAGQNRDYIVQQMRDFKNGVRECADPRKTNYRLMIDTAKGMTENEFAEVAEYMQSMKWSKWIEVIETDTVPKTYLRGGLHIPLEGEEAGIEPIGKRIIETPADPYRTEFLRDPRSGFIAYVPTGSIEKGEKLVTTGDSGKTLQCALCHGPELKGIGSIPAIAARSPSYMARQLNDLKQGTRKGTMAALMQPVVVNLTSEDILNMVAYLASLPESPPEHSKK